MRQILLVLVSVFSLAAFAENLPSNSTQVIFENLVKAANKKAKFKSPMEIEARDFSCTHGSGNSNSVKCKAIFRINGKDVEKEIPNSSTVFRFLNSLNAITVGDVLIGSMTYRTQKLNCIYDNSSTKYYQCKSEPVIIF